MTIEVSHCEMSHCAEEGPYFPTNTVECFFYRSNSNVETGTFFLGKAMFEGSNMLCN